MLSISSLLYVWVCGCKYLKPPLSPPWQSQLSQKRHCCCGGCRRSVYFCACENRNLSNWLGLTEREVQNIKWKLQITTCFFIICNKDTDPLVSPVLAIYHFTVVWFQHANLKIAHKKLFKKGGSTFSAAFYLRLLHFFSRHGSQPD